MNSQILVRRTLNHGRPYEPKSRTSRRKINLAPELVHELKKWQLACPPTALDLVFPSVTGDPEHGSNMLKGRFFPAFRRSKLPKIRFHNLRHTYASLLIDQGKNPKYIQNQLGHSSIQVTMDIYGRLLKNVNQEAASRLGKVVLGSTGEDDGSKMVAAHKKGANG